MAPDHWTRWTELLRTYEKLGILDEQQRWPVSCRPRRDWHAAGATSQMWSAMSIATTFKETLAEAGVIFVRSRAQLSRTGAKIPAGHSSATTTTPR